jgi:amino acid transporter
MTAEEAGARIRGSRAGARDAGDHHAPLRSSALSVRTLFLLVFILVSAGPFGVEEMVSSSGPGMSLLLLLIVPVIWGGPLALICTELASAVPEEGGAYAWVERALGRFWAFQSGWWASLSGLVDTALYVVLAVDYANRWLGQPDLVRWLLAVLVITVFAVLNVRSLRGVALSSAAFAVMILLPCAALTVIGFANWTQSPFTPLVPDGSTTFASLGLGLTVAIWFYSGYESLPTMAGEIERPERVIPRALLLSLPVVIAVYMLPTIAALASVGRWAEWGADGGVDLVSIGGELGGAWLAVPMMIAALVSSLSLYNAYLAANARTALAMAEAGQLPRFLARVHPRFGTPHASILALALAHAVLATGSFETLLVIDVFLFVMSYFLIFASAVVLRVREPALARPFRIPLGNGGVLLLASVPTVVGLFMLFANRRDYLIGGALATATGPIAYWVAERRGKGAGSR